MQAYTLTYIIQLICEDISTHTHTHSVRDIHISIHESMRASIHAHIYYAHTQRTQNLANTHIHTTIVITQSAQKYSKFVYKYKHVTHLYTSTRISIYSHVYTLPDIVVNIADIQTYIYTLPDIYT